MRNDCISCQLLERDCVQANLLTRPSNRHNLFLTQPHVHGLPTLHVTSCREESARDVHLYYKIRPGPLSSHPVACHVFAASLG